MTAKRDREPPAQIDGAALFAGIGIGLLGASSAVGVPVGLSVTTPGPMIAVAVPCFVFFAAGLYAVIAVFTRRLPLPEIRYRSKTAEGDPEPEVEDVTGPGQTADPPRKEQEEKEQQDMMARALFEDSRPPETGEDGMKVQT